MKHSITTWFNQSVFITAMILISHSNFAQLIARRPVDDHKPTIAIVKIEPEKIIEGHPIYIYFKVNNTGNEQKPRTGWVGATCSASNEYDNNSINDWPISQLDYQQSTYGVVSTLANKEGLDRIIKIFYYESRQQEMEFSIKKDKIVAMDSKTIDIGALFNYRLDKFVIRHTRSVHEDTNFGALNAQVGEQPVMKPLSIFMGNFNDGTHLFNGKDGRGNYWRSLATGTFFLTRRHPNLQINYGIVNAGATIQTAVREFLDKLSGATAGVLNAMYRTNQWDLVDKFTRSINESFTFNCDGPVVIDTLDIHPNWLFSMTNANKTFRWNRVHSGEDYKSNNGCGKTSDYTVQSTIERITLAPFQCNPAIIYAVRPGKRVRLNCNNGINWLKLQLFGFRDQLIDAAGSQYGIIKDGMYTAPQTVDKPILLVVRGELISRDFSKSPELITAFVQLAPPAMINPHILSNRIQSTNK